MKTILFNKLRKQGYSPMDFLKKDKDEKYFNEAPVNTVYGVRCFGGVTVFFDSKGKEIGDDYNEKEVLQKLYLFDLKRLNKTYKNYKAELQKKYGII